eukprot:jgi/Tetstr1/447026/TSEL_034484.t1
MATLRASNVTPTDTAYANDLLASALRTLATVNARSEDRLTYIRRFNCKTTLSGEDRVAAPLVYNPFFDPAVAERGANGVDGLLAALDDKQLEVSLLQAAKAQAATHFKGGSGGSGDSGGGGGAGGTKPTKTGTATRSDGVRRRADSCIPNSNCMRHSVGRSWRYWSDIGASAQTLRWIREGVRIPFRHSRPPKPFHCGMSALEATPAQVTFLEAELARFV